MTSSFQIVGDYYITAPTHKLAQMMSSRSVPVYLYNYEYQSKYAQWEGILVVICIITRDSRDQLYKSLIFIVILSI